MLDVKKLITGFLILALGTSTAAWILSGTKTSQNAGVSAPSSISLGMATSSLGTDAFYPSQTNNGVVLPSDDTSSSTNLTDTFADAVVNGIVAANPNGLQTDANGSTTIAIPDSETIASAIQNSPALQKVALPDWDTEVAALQNKINVVSYSSTTALNYVTNFSNVINSQLVETGLSGMAQNGSLPDNESSVITSGKSAASIMLSHALAFPTPTLFVGYQKSLIKMLVYERDLAQLVLSSSNDPATMAVVLQAKENDYQVAVQEFSNQGQELSSALVAYNKNLHGTGTLLSFVDSVFLIHQADATGVPVVDILEKIETALGFTSQNATQWATFFEKLAKDIALQIVKNMLMALVQQKVLTYIQGSGAPRFVTDAATAAVNAAEMDALGAINKNFSCINSQTVLPRVSLMLKALYKPVNNACAAQFQSQISSANLNNFYNSFSNGGFFSFATTLQPSNDFYAGLFNMSQEAGQAAQQGTNLFTMKTTASQGYTNNQQCADGSNPNGSHWECYGADGSDDYAIDDPSVNPNEAAACTADGDDPEEVPNAGKCSNGQDAPVTMPGIVNKDSVDTALKGHTQLISAANDVIGLIQAAAESLIMGLANEGIQAATNAFNGALATDPGITGISTSTVGAPGVATSTASLPLMCTPATSTIPAPSVETSFFAQGGTYDANGNAPTYNWLSSDGRTGVGSEFDIVYNATGTYTVSLQDSAGDPSTTCVAVITDAANASSTSTATTTYIIVQ